MGFCREKKKMKASVFIVEYRGVGGGRGREEEKEGEEKGSG